MFAEAEWSITPLSTSGLPGDSAVVSGISSDGSTVVGRADGKAVIWTSPTPQILNNIDNSFNVLNVIGVSTNGAVVAGTCMYQSATHAFRWTAQNGFELLGIPPNFGFPAGNVNVVGISSNGNRLALRNTPYSGNNSKWAFWNVGTGFSTVHSFSGEGQELYVGNIPHFNDPSLPLLNALSPDGTTLTGSVWFGAAPQHYQPWVFKNGTATILPVVLTNGSHPFGYAAFATSNLGKVIVGTTWEPEIPNMNGYCGFKYALGRYSYLPDLVGSEDAAFTMCVSANGTVAAGSSRTELFGRVDEGPFGSATVWSESGDAYTVRDLLTRNGVSVGDARLFHVVSISKDGTALAVQGSSLAATKAGFLVRIGSLALRKISGRIELQDRTPEAPMPPAFYVEIAGVRTDQVAVGPNGEFAMIAPGYMGPYDLLVRHSHWLQRRVHIDTRSGHIQGLTISLLNGDVDSDNEITLVDFGALTAAFGSVEGEAHWNPDADLDEDGEVSLVDSSIIAKNFGISGDD